MKLKNIFLLGIAYFTLNSARAQSFEYSARAKAGQEASDQIGPLLGLPARFGADVHVARASEDKTNTPEEEKSFTGRTGTEFLRRLSRSITETPQARLGRTLEASLEKLRSAEHTNEIVVKNAQDRFLLDRYRVERPNGAQLSERVRAIKTAYTVDRIYHDGVVEVATPRSGKNNRVEVSGARLEENIKTLKANIEAAIRDPRYSDDVRTAATKFIGTLDPKCDGRLIEIMRNAGNKLGEYREGQMAILYGMIKYSLSENPEEYKNPLLIALAFSGGKTTLSRNLMKVLNERFGGNLLEVLNEGFGGTKRFIYIAADGGQSAYTEDGKPDGKPKEGYYIFAPEHIGVKFDPAEAEGKVIVITQTSSKHEVIYSKMKQYADMPELFTKDSVVFLDEAAEGMTSSPLSVAKPPEFGKKWAEDPANKAEVLKGKNRAKFMYTFMKAVDEVLAENSGTEAIPSIIEKQDVKSGRGAILDAFEFNPALKLREAVEARMKKYGIDLGSKEVADLYDGTQINHLFDGAAQLRNALGEGKTLARIDEHGHPVIDPIEIYHNGEVAENRVHSDESGLNAYSQAYIAELARIGIRKADGSTEDLGLVKTDSQGNIVDITQKGMEVWGQHVIDSESTKATMSEVISLIQSRGGRVIGLTGAPGDADQMMRMSQFEYLQLNRNVHLGDFNYLFKILSKLNTMQAIREILLDHFRGGNFDPTQVMSVTNTVKLEYLLRTVGVEKITDLMREAIREAGYDGKVALRILINKEASGGIEELAKDVQKSIPEITEDELHAQMEEAGTRVSPEDVTRETERRISAEEIEMDPVHNILLDSDTRVPVDVRRDLVMEEAARLAVAEKLRNNGVERMAGHDAKHGRAVPFAT